MGEAKRQIGNLTGVRAFAALWVMIGHFSANTGIKDVLDLGQLVAHSPWGVDLFFVLSGLILTYTYRRESLDGSHYRLFIVKRFARLYPLHIATFVLMVLVWWCARSMGYQFRSQMQYSGYTAVLHLLFLQGWGLSSSLSWNGVSWSASAEWFAYLFVFPFCILVAAKISAWKLVALVAFLWAALFLVANVVYDRDVTNMTSAGYLRVIPEFIAGYLVFREAARFKVSGDWGVIVGVVAIISAALIGIDLLLLPPTMMLLWGLYRGGPLGNAIFGNPVAVFLGEISYSLYLTHGFVKLASDQFIRRAPDALIALTPKVLLVVDVLVAVGTAIAFYYAIERPCRRWIVRRYKVNSAAGRTVLTIVQ